jgi:predicted GNAT family acetyltransferase
MHATRYTDLDAFAARVAPYLFAHEAEHCLPLGILSNSKQDPSFLSEPPYLACVAEEDGRIALVAIQTPPQNIVLSLLANGSDTEAAIQALVSDAHEAHRTLPGVHAPVGLAEVFARAWSALTGNRYQADVRERIYRLRQVRWPRPAPGVMRHIDERDRDLLRVWLRDFMREALGQEISSVDGMIDRRLRTGPGGMYLWEDGQPVSVTGFGSPTPHGIRIGPVYTPPELRGCGYASALVAKTSQRLLDEGRQFCFLFTDLANPTSNHIYQQIGYEPICDVAEYRFQSPNPDV